MKKEHEIAYVTTFLVEEDLLDTPEELIQKRTEICNSCDKIRKDIEMKKPNIHMDHENEEIDVEYTVEKVDLCLECGCMIHEKVENWVSICPLNKWQLTYEEWEEYFLPLVKDNIKQNGSNPLEWGIYTND